MFWGLHFPFSASSKFPLSASQETSMQTCSIGLLSAAYKIFYKLLYKISTFLLFRERLAFPIGLSSCEHLMPTSLSQFAPETPGPPLKWGKPPTLSVTTPSSVLRGSHLMNTPLSLVLGSLSRASSSNLHREKSLLPLTLPVLQSLTVHFPKRSHLGLLILPSGGK